MQAGFTQIPPQPSGGKKVVLGILIFLIVLLILSGIGFGVWYFFIKEDEDEDEDEIEDEMPSGGNTTTEEPSGEEPEEPEEPDYLGNFTLFPGHALKGNNIKCSKDSTPETCAQNCLETENCKSFDFNTSSNNCCLSSKTRKTAQSAYTEYPDGAWNFYELKGVEQPVTDFLGKFLHFPGHALKGNNMKCIQNLTPNTCAQNCIETDGCKSFDFNNSSNSCCLSTKTSRTAQSAYTKYPNGEWNFYELPMTSTNIQERILGQACNDVYKCVNGKCENGVCVDYEDPEPTGGTNFECTKNSDCGRGLSCSSSRQCKKESGVTCVRPSECASGQCVNRKCK